MFAGSHRPSLLTWTRSQSVTSAKRGLKQLTYRVPTFLFKISPLRLSIPLPIPLLHWSCYLSRIVINRFGPYRRLATLPQQCIDQESAMADSMQGTLLTKRNSKWRSSGAKDEVSHSQHQGQRLGQQLATIALEGDCFAASEKGSFGEGRAALTVRTSCFLSFLVTQS